MICEINAFKQITLNGVSSQVFLNVSDELMNPAETVETVLV